MHTFYPAIYVVQLQATLNKMLQTVFLLWDFKFSQRRVWSSDLSSGMYFIRAMMEAARTSETSVDNYFTRQYIPEDKSELVFLLLTY
jgi:hypothetical protein